MLPLHMNAALHAHLCPTARRAEASLHKGAVLLLQCCLPHLGSAAPDRKACAPNAVACAPIAVACAGHESWVLSVSAHPSGTAFATGSSDSKVGRHTLLPAGRHGICVGGNSDELHSAPAGAAAMWVLHQGEVCSRSVMARHVRAMWDPCSQRATPVLVCGSTRLLVASKNLFHGKLVPWCPAGQAVGPPNPHLRAGGCCCRCGALGAVWGCISVGAGHLGAVQLTESVTSFVRRSTSTATTCRAPASTNINS